ncbi:hypothetical protein EXIGLDRAFT_763099 [Exidia glandulosa HHB12029]|uniref:Fe2OG dioxygenase domain-containing protein n=1 Tax=Exidia glandulosa HHB12029 TaxID=1314781 RepID=A0A165M7E9_EXIGL|nr:hypothetical protein EXIGLDRAFT_763099 [Exidia glandulosa HHB12029]
MQYVDDHALQSLESSDAGAHPPLGDPLGADTLDWRTLPRFTDECPDPVESYYKGGPRWPIPPSMHPLGKLLSQVSLPKWWNFNDRRLSYNLGEVRLTSTSDDAPLGTIAALDLEALHSLLEPSHFGRGAETVYDEAVRKGLEVTAAKMHIKSWAGPPELSDTDWDLDAHQYSRRQTGQPDPFAALARDIQERMFPGRPVTLKLYKLALYKPGGHFQFHLDSTHADSHHGSLLVGCGISGYSSYEGGHLILRSEGEEAVFQLQAGEALAFYTDVLHAVSPVTYGTRATLQFDIYLEGSTGRDDESNDAAARINTVASVEAPATLASSRSNMGRIIEPVIENTKHGRPHPNDIRFNISNPNIDSSRPVPSVACTELMAEFVQRLTTVLQYGDSIPLAPPRTVVFLLSHVYRRMSIRPSYLKGADAALYNALMSSGELAVFLNPVMYNRYRYYYIDEENRDDSPTIVPCKPFAPPFTNDNPPTFAEPVLILDRGGEADLVVNDEISIGNDGCGEFWRYSAGAMFVTLAQNSSE